MAELLYHLDAREHFGIRYGRLFEGEEAENVLSEEFGSTGYFPVMQQFWKALGQRGSMTFYDRGWYSVAAQDVINMLPEEEGKAFQERTRCG